MASIRKSLLQFIFAGSFMKRWNDKLRPVELLEVDKQAHKMIAAWMLYQHNSRSLDLEERLTLGQTVVEGGLFDYLYRLVITDIKPPIFYQIKSNPEHYRQLTEWVLAELEPKVQTLGQPFWDRLCAYFYAEIEDPVFASNDVGRRILNAAHLYASYWEFNLLKPINTFDDEFKEIDESFRMGLESHLDLEGVRDLLAGVSGPLGKLAHLCGQLRFQKRWSQTPRIPETSVMGHMFLVAVYAYFFSLAQDACRARVQNNFFSGLFHDLPEMLTRDIISPVKKSVQHVGDLIREYENKELRRRVLDPLESAGYDNLSERLQYFLGLEVGSEFADVVCRNGAIDKVTFEDLQGACNRDELDPKDGEMLKVCDMLAAFIEAYTAMRNGISSDQLHQAVWRMRGQYKRSSLGNVHIGALLADFD